MNNVNEYNVSKFKEEFLNTDLYRTLEKDFDHLVWTKYWPYQKHASTPRQIWGDRLRETYFSLTPFYYLKPLLEKSPDTIYDLGCGWNIFKKYIPNIVGVDFNDDYRDIDDQFDDEYVKHHQQYFESVFSICALHFCSLTKFENQIQQFVSMIKPGGRGYLALNFQRFTDFTSETDLIKLFNTAKPNGAMYNQFIRDALSNIDCNYLIVDVDISNHNEQMDGNIRIVVEAK